MISTASLKRYDLEMIEYALDRARRILDHLLILPADERPFPFPWDDYKDITYACDLVRKIQKSCRA